MTETKKSIIKNNTTKNILNEEEFSRKTSAQTQVKPLKRFDDLVEKNEPTIRVKSGNKKVEIANIRLNSSISKKSNNDETSTLTMKLKPSIKKTTNGNRSVDNNKKSSYYTGQKQNYRGNSEMQRNIGFVEKNKYSQGPMENY